MSMMVPTGPPPEAVGDNDYLQAVLANGTISSGWAWEWPPITGKINVGRLTARYPMVNYFSWAIPNDAALDAIAKLSPIVEAGAGGGYWAMLLRARGALIRPYDLHPYPLLNPSILHAWTPVSRGGPRQTLGWGRALWTLLLCWPTYGGVWAEQAVELHEGKHLVHIGEWGGCTGTDRLEELITERYSHVEDITIPKWVGLHDYVSIWERK